MAIVASAILKASHTRLSGKHRTQGKAFRRFSVPMKTKQLLNETKSWETLYLIISKVL
jgi:hypothetical protein